MRSVDILLTNSGPTDLYELAWFAPLIEYSAKGKTDCIQRATDVTLGHERRPLGTFLPETLPPGRSRRIYLEFGERDDEGAERALKPTIVPLVTFIDADGYRMGYVARSVDEPGEQRFSMGWDVVGDGYPNPGSVSGRMRELLRKSHE